MSESKPIRITLFHADWCGHCTRFLPTWEFMKGNQKAQKNIDFVAYESKEIPALPENVRQINGEKIEGYPTIKIDINGHEYNYMQQRDPNSIYKFIKDRLVNIARGKPDLNESKTGGDSTNTENLTQEPETEQENTTSNVDLGTIDDDDEKVVSISSQNQDTDENTGEETGGTMFGGGCNGDDDSHTVYAPRIESDVLNFDLNEIDTLSEIIRFE